MELLGRGTQNHQIWIILAHLSGCHTGPSQSRAICRTWSCKLDASSDSQARRGNRGGNSVVSVEIWVCGLLFFNDHASICQSYRSALKLALNSELELLSLRLHAILRTRPTIIRRPAAVPAVADPPEHTTMWYKSHCKVGVRRQFGDRKQCFQFGHSNQSKEFLMASKLASA